MSVQSIWMVGTQGLCSQSSLRSCLHSSFETHLCVGCKFVWEGFWANPLRRKERNQE